MESLGLDWKLFMAQIVNFGILFFVLSKFIYKPISKLLEERKKKIEESLLNSNKIEERLLRLEEKEKAVLKKAETEGLKKKDDLMYLAEKEKEEVLMSAKFLAERETQKAVAKIKSLELEVYANIKEKVMCDVVANVIDKLTKDSKKSKYPMLQKILK